MLQQDDCCNKIKNLLNVLKFKFSNFFFILEYFKLDWPTEIVWHACSYFYLRGEKFNDTGKSAVDFNLGIGMHSISIADHTSVHSGHNLLIYWNYKTTAERFAMYQLLRTIFQQVHFNLWCNVAVKLKFPFSYCEQKGGVMLNYSISSFVYLFVDVAS